MRKIGYSCYFKRGTTNAIITSKPVGADHKLVFYAIKWEKRPFRQSSSTGLLPLATIKPNVLTSQVEFESDDTLRYIYHTKAVDKSILYGNFNGSNGDTMDLMDFTNDLKEWTSKQTFGRVINSTIQSSSFASRNGFAQFVGSWESRTRLNVFIVFNDPEYRKSGIKEGRFIVLHRKKEV